MNVDESFSSTGTETSSSRVVAETVPLIQSGVVDGMDVDVGFGAGGAADVEVQSSPPQEHQAVNVAGGLASKGIGRDVGLVIDTSTAIWNRPPQKDGAAVEAPAWENEDAERNEGPVRKKQKSDVGSMAHGTETDGLTRKPGYFVIGSLKPKAGLKIVVDPDVTKGNVPVAKDTRDRLRDRLAGFARAGSQVPLIQPLELDREDADSGVGLKMKTKKDLGRRSTNSMRPTTSCKGNRWCLLRSPVRRGRYLTNQDRRLRRHS
jgi:hypothetical protein